MSFNIYDTIINRLSTQSLGSYSPGAANARTDMALIICAPIMQVHPTQYNGPIHRYELLKHLCNQVKTEIESHGSPTHAIVDNLVSVADGYGVWLYPGVSAVYYCNQINVMISTTIHTEDATATTSTSSIDVTQTTSTNSILGVVTGVSDNSIPVVDNVSDNLEEVVYDVIDNYVTLRFAGAAIVPKAPTNNAELYLAIQQCGNATATAIYKAANLCSDNTNPFDQSAHKTLCIGALLSSSPAWNEGLLE